MESLVKNLEELGIQLDAITLEILKILEKGKEISENVIADRLKLKINAVRKLLYGLHTRGIVDYTKKRDPKKKWWYIYFWSLDKGKISQLCVEYKQREIEKRKQQLEIESCFAFECKTCDKRFSYEDALESEYMCPACGNILEELASNKLCRRLQNEIQVLESQLNSLKSAEAIAKPAVGQAREKTKAIAKKAAPKKKLVKVKTISEKAKPGKK